MELNKIYNEDCLETMSRMPDNSIDFIFTDPPYGHNNNNGDMASRWEAIFEGKKDSYIPEKDWRPIANDGIEANVLIQKCFKEWYRILKPGSCCCCCCGGGGGPDPQFARWSLWLDEAFKGGFKHMIIWDKGPMGMGHHYRRSYETILVAQKKGAACKWYAESKDIENIIRPGMYGIGKIIPQANQHPTEKPAKLAKLFIHLHSEEGDIIYDPFIGSGSTIQAAIQLKRNWIGSEISAEYCKLAEKRIEPYLMQKQIDFNC
jgi:site-specific DNA-methyltransferase (adenine-specific)